MISVLSIPRRYRDVIARLACWRWITINEIPSRDTCGRCLELREQLRRLLPPGVALPRQERPNARLAEPVRVRGARVPLEERERDLTVQIAEQAERPGPEPLELGPQLVDQRRPGTDQIFPPAGQRPDRLRGIRIGLQHPEAMMIGPRELAQNER